MCKVHPVKRLKPGLILRRSPLIYFLAQLRFSQVLSLGKYVPDIQDLLRRSGFPGFRQTQIPQLKFQGSITPTVELAELFEFQDKETSTGIILTPSFISYHTTHYSVYEDFEGRFREVLMAVQKVLNISVLERWGLRYIDLVQPRQDESLEDYLRSETLGLSASEIGVTNPTSTYTLNGNTLLGRLVLRVSQIRGPASPLPADLQPGFTLNLESSVSDGELVAVLDFDHFAEAKADFSIDAAVERLGNLHEGIERAFASAVTPNALVLWESQANA